MARRTEMKNLVDKVPASAQARERAKVILLTLSRMWSVQAGCEWLGVGRTRFQDLRRRMLGAAVGALDEKVAGRPRTRMQRTCKELKALRRRMVELEHELTLAQTELDIARGPAAVAVSARVAAKGGRR